MRIHNFRYTRNIIESYKCFRHIINNNKINSRYYSKLLNNNNKNNNKIITNKRYFNTKNNTEKDNTDKAIKELLNKPLADTIPQKIFFSLGYLAGLAPIIFSMFAYYYERNEQFRHWMNNNAETVSAYYLSSTSRGVLKSWGFKTYDQDSDEYKSELYDKDYAVETLKNTEDRNKHDNDLNNDENQLNKNIASDNKNEEIDNNNDNNDHHKNDINVTTEDKKENEIIHKEIITDNENNIVENTITKNENENENNKEEKDENNNNNEELKSETNIINENIKKEEKEKKDIKDIIEEKEENEKSLEEKYKDKNNKKLNINEEFENNPIFQGLKNIEEKGKVFRMKTLDRIGEEIVSETESLRKELEENLLKDLGSLNEEQLRYRVVQLVAEMQERTKWEALRLHQAIKKVDDELTTKYQTLLENQREEFLIAIQNAIQNEKINNNNQIDELINEMKENYNKELNELLKIQEDKLKDEYDTKLSIEREDLQRYYNDKLIELNQKVVKHSHDRRLYLLEIEAQVLGMIKAFEKINEYKVESYYKHQLSSIFLKFVDTLIKTEDNIIMRKELKNDIYDIINKDEFLKTIIDTLPNNIWETNIPNLGQLRNRFKDVEEAARTAYLTPGGENPGLIGQVVGHALAIFSLKPKGLVDGDTAEEYLARINYYLEVDDLISAVNEANILKEKNKDEYEIVNEVINDWLTDANNRIIVDQSISSILSYLSLINSQYS